MIFFNSSPSPCIINIPIICLTVPNLWLCFLGFAKLDDFFSPRYSDIIMASHITGLSIVYSIPCSGAGQRKHRSSASLTFVRRIHRWPVNSPHKIPVTRKIIPFDAGLGSNTFYQIQIQIHRQKSDQIQIQIQIQPIKYKYKYTLRPRQKCRNFKDYIFKCKKIVLLIVAE